MGLFGFLRRKLLKASNLSESWVEDAAHGLDIDFNQGSLGGVVLGQPFDDLAWLGPADSHMKSHWAVYYSHLKEITYYNYCAKGLQIAEYRGTFQSVNAHFQRALGPTPYQGVCIHNGSRLQLSPQSTVADILEQLGEPKSREVFVDFNEFTDLRLVFDLGREVIFSFPLPDSPSESDIAKNHYVIDHVSVAESQ